MPRLGCTVLPELPCRKTGSGVKPAILRLFYRDLTGDCSASHDLPESVVHERVHEMLNMEPEDGCRSTGGEKQGVEDKISTFLE